MSEAGSDTKDMGFGVLALRHLLRAQRCDLTRVNATAGERKALETAGITNPAARDYMAWRRSMAFVALGFAVVALVFALIDAIGTLSDFSEAAYVTGVASLLVLVEFGSKLALGIGLFLAVRHWTDARRSRRAMTAGWAIAIVVPLLFILLPLTDVMFNWDAVRSSAGAAVAGAERAVIETMVAVMMFWGAVPSLLALFPGLVRAGLTVKTLAPARGIGPVVAACVAPIYAVFFVVVFGQIQQLSGSVLMGLGILLVAAAPLVLVKRCPRLMPPLEPAEAALRVGRARNRVRLLSVIGLLLVLITLFSTKMFGRPVLGFDGDAALFSVWSFVNILAWFVAMLTTYTVVASDGLVGAMRTADRNTKTWSEDAARGRDDEVVGTLAEALMSAPAARAADESA